MSFSSTQLLTNSYPSIGPHVIHANIVDSFDKKVAAVAISSDSKLIASGTASLEKNTRDSNSSISVLSLEKGKRVLTLDLGNDNVWSLAYDPKNHLGYSGELLAAGLNDAIAIWDTHTGVKVTNLSLYGTNAVFSLAYSPNGKYLAAVSGHRIIIWDIAMQTTSQLLKKDPEYTMTQVSYSPGGALLASTSYNVLRDISTVDIWDVMTGASRTLVTVPGNPIISLAYSPNGINLALGLMEGAYIWDIWDIEASAHTVFLASGSVSSLAYSSNGLFLAIGSGNQVTRWNTTTAQRVNTLRGHVSGHVDSIAYSPNGTFIAGGLGSDTVIWDVL